MDIADMSNRDKMVMIRHRYKSTKDLHQYMVERLGYLLPSLKNCRLKHIQDILSRKKKVLLLKDCSAKKTPSWPQLSVKNCYHVVTKNCPAVLDYLPDPHGLEQKLPERETFWTVMHTLMPEESE